jgi:adenylyltransferase/sulfurtransferase
MTPDDLERYSRQIRFAGLGREGQQRLLSSKVAVIGCGALGSFQAGALARAGVGSLLLLDRDYVELSNLHRQWLYDESDVEQSLPKAAAAANHLRRVNSKCSVTPLVVDLTAANIEQALGGADLILDGTDNFETRYLINDFCVARGIPWVYGAAVGSYGLTMPVVPSVTPCLACIYPAPPEGTQQTCETSGVLGPLTSVIASFQAASALKILAGAEVAPLLTTVDVWTGVVRQLRHTERNPDCRACALGDFAWLNAARRPPDRLCGRNAVQIHDRHHPVDLAALRAQLEPLGSVRMNEFALRFVTAPYDLTIFADGRAIIKGTEDPGIARSLYARYVGT